MTEQAIIFDPSILYNLYFRVNRNTVPQTIIFSGLTNVNTKTWQLNFYTNESDVGLVTPVLQALSGSGLTLGTDRITINLTDTQTNIAPRVYYWQLLNVTDKQTFLNGRAYFHKGEFDNVSTAGADTITVMIAGVEEAPIDGQQYARKNAGWEVVFGGGGGGDMILASVQTVTGAKTFNDGTLLMRNVANTFSSTFTNTNTAARTYTLPNVTGTVALTSDLNGWLTGSLNASTNVDVGANDFTVGYLHGTNPNSFIGVGNWNGTSSLISLFSAGGPISSDEVKLEFDLGNQSGNGAGVIFTDLRTTKKGIQYGAAGYVTTDRSLTDRGYVLGALNGWLTGTLTASTTITTADFLTIQTGIGALSSIDILSNDGVLGIGVTNDLVVLGSSLTILELSKATSNLVFEDLRGTPRGIEYAAAGYVTQDRSLTDRGYVLGALNGWLNGTLTANTTISGSFNVGFTNNQVGIGVAPGSMTASTKFEIRGDGTTSGTNAVRVASSTNTSLFRLRDDGGLFTGVNDQGLFIDGGGAGMWRPITNSFTRIANDGTVSSQLLFYGSTHATLADRAELYARLFTSTCGGNLFVQNAQSSGWNVGLTVTPGAQTSLTASTAFPNQVFSSATLSWVSVAGTIAAQKDTEFRAITHSAATSGTFTDLYNVFMEQPAVGGSATATRRFSLGLGGPVQIAIGTSLGSALANTIGISARDSSDGSANATLAMYLEQAPESTATFTQSHRLKIWVNGTEYYLPLDNV